MIFNFLSFFIVKGFRSFLCAYEFYFLKHSTTLFKATCLLTKKKLKPAIRGPINCRWNCGKCRVELWEMSDGIVGNAGWVVETIVRGRTNFFAYLKLNKKPKRLENSQLLRKTWHTNQIFELILQSWTYNQWTFYNFCGISHKEPELGEAFIYIIRKPIDFSIDFSHRLKTFGHMVIGLKQVRVSSGNLVPSLSTENHLLSLSELADRK